MSGSRIPRPYRDHVTEKIWIYLNDHHGQIVNNPTANSKAMNTHQVK